MPIYEYQCQQCGQLVEFIQKVDDAPKTVCPSCNQNSLHRCISRTSFQLKGSGWYVTDFRDQGAKTTGNTPTSTESTSTTPSGDKPSKSE